MDFALLRWRKMRFTHIGRSTGSSWAVATSIQTRKNVRVLSKHVKTCFIWFVFWWGELVRSESDVTGHPLEGYSGYSIQWWYNTLYIYDILWLHDVTCARDGNPYSESLGYLLILKHCRWPFEISPSSGLRAVSRLSESWVGIWACLKIGYSEFPQLLSHIITIPDYPH